MTMDMKDKDFKRNFMAGLFLIAGVYLLISFIFFLCQDKGFAQNKFRVTVLYKNIGGLVEGAPVRLSGVTVGSVATIDFLDQEVDEHRVRVVLNILSRFRKQFDQNLRFVIKTEGILGEKLIEIDVRDGEKIDLTKPIMGEDPLDVQDLAKEFAHAAEAFTKTADEMSKIDMLELSNVMIDSSRALLETANGLNEIMSELQDITVKSRRVFDRVEQKLIEGNLFKVF